MAESETPVDAHGDADGDDHGDAIHMPPNSYWPLVASFGTAGVLLGMIYLNSAPYVEVVGALILIVGVGGWIRDAMTEYRELH